MVPIGYISIDDAPAIHPRYTPSVNARTGLYERRTAVLMSIIVDPYPRLAIVI